MRRAFSAVVPGWEGDAGPPALPQIPFLFQIVVVRDDFHAHGSGPCPGMTMSGRLCPDGPARSAPSREGAIRRLPSPYRVGSFRHRDEGHGGGHAGHVPPSLRPHPGNRSMALARDAPWTCVAHLLPLIPGDVSGTVHRPVRSSALTGRNASPQRLRRWPTVAWTCRRSPVSHGKLCLFSPASSAGGGASSSPGTFASESSPLRRQNLTFPLSEGTIAWDAYPGKPALAAPSVRFHPENPGGPGPHPPDNRRFRNVLFAGCLMTTGRL